MTSSKIAGTPLGESTGPHMDGTAGWHYVISGVPEEHGEDPCAHFSVFDTKGNTVSRLDFPTGMFKMFMGGAHSNMCDLNPVELRHSGSMYPESKATRFMIRMTFTQLPMTEPEDWILLCYEILRNIDIRYVDGTNQKAVQCDDTKSGSKWYRKPYSSVSPIPFGIDDYTM